MLRYAKAALPLDVSYTLFAASDVSYTDALSSLQLDLSYTPFAVSDVSYTPFAVSDAR